jgi:hypothetical protein
MTPAEHEGLAAELLARFPEAETGAGGARRAPRAEIVGMIRTIDAALDRPDGPPDAPREGDGRRAWILEFAGNLLPFWLGTAGRPRVPAVAVA